MCPEFSPYEVDGEGPGDIRVRTVSGERRLIKSAAGFLASSAAKAIPGFRAILASDVTAGAALTKTDDTNVTLTLGGSPTVALLAASSITVSWSGTLAVSRGGIGVGTLASNAVLYGNGTGAVQALAVNSTATNKYLQQVSSGTPSWTQVAFSDLSGTITTAQIPDRTRSMFVPASDQWKATTGTPDFAVRGSTANHYEKFGATAFDGAADEAIVITLCMPADWNAGAVTPTIIWAPSTNDAGNVLWNYTGKGVAAGQQFDQTQEFSISALSAAGGTAENRVDLSLTAFTPDSAIFTIVIWRVAGNAADTYDAHDAWFCGLFLSYTADS